MLYCTQCGTPTTGDQQKFCTKCGAGMQAETGPPVTSGPASTLAAGDETATALGPSLDPAAPPVSRQPEPETVAGGPGPGSTPNPWSREASHAPAYQVDTPYTPPPPPPSAYQPPFGGPAYDYGPAAQAPPSYSPGPARPALRPQTAPKSRTAPYLALLVIAVVVLGGAGGFAVWKYVLHKSPAGTPSASSAGPASQGGSGAPAAHSPSPTPPASATPAASATASPGVTGITLSPAAQAQSDASQVGQFVVTYFAAINAHSYGKYTALLDPSQVPVPSRGQFRAGFGSTTDSAEKITSITSSSGLVEAAVKFTSHQSPSASPTSTNCTAWRITLFLEPNGGSFLIGHQLPGYHAKFRAC